MTAQQRMNANATVTTHRLVYPPMRTVVSPETSLWSFQVSTHNAK